VPWHASVSVVSVACAAVQVRIAIRATMRGIAVNIPHSWDGCMGP
jgi:hypothetical protein